MSSKDKRPKPSFDHFTDEQLYQEFKRVQKLANESQSLAAGLIKELRRRKRTQVQEKNND